MREGVEEGGEMGVEEGEEEGSGDTSSAAADTPDLLFLTFPFAFLGTFRLSTILYCALSFSLVTKNIPSSFHF